MDIKWRCLSKRYGQWRTAIPREAQGETSLTRKERTSQVLEMDGEVTLRCTRDFQQGEEVTLVDDSDVEDMAFL